MSLAHGICARVNGSHARDDHRADRSCCDAEPELHSRNWMCRARSRRKPVRKRDKQWREGRMRSVVERALGISGL